MYNLKDASGHEVTNLQLSPGTIAKIFTGEITDWDDPAITRRQPAAGAAFDAARPRDPLRRVGDVGPARRLPGARGGVDLGPVRSAAPRAAAAQFWPDFPRAVAERGSDGVANYMANPSVGQGSIGYVEAGYAYERSMAPAYIRNASGNFTLPTSENVAIALKQARMNEDRTQNLDGRVQRTRGRRVSDVQLQLHDHPHHRLRSREGRGARRVDHLHRLRGPAEGGAARLFAAAAEPGPAFRAVKRIRAHAGRTAR